VNDELVNASLVKAWARWALVWLTFFPLVGVLISIQLHNPEFLGGISWFTFGDEVVTEFSAEGYGSYRINTAFMDKVADTYGPVQGSINRRVKKALDPNGILAPGKSGIR
jgi:FAD linked oxidases, C-terminal domain